MITILSMLAVFRLTYMLQEEAGPGDILFKLRTVINKNEFAASLLGCFWCFSVWVSVPFAVYLSSNSWEFVVYTLALSAGAGFVSLTKDHFSP